MAVRPATREDLPEIRHLLHSNNRTFLNCGYEDLPGLIDHGIFILGEEEDDDAGGNILWGVMAFQRQQRLESLPENAPDRIGLRAAALRRSVFAGYHLSGLVKAAVAGLQEDVRRKATQQQNMLMYALTTHDWILSAVTAAGFEETDQIRFYVRTERNVPVVPQTANMRLVSEQELDELARLDGETFDSLWHAGRQDLLELCFSSRLRVAEYQGKLAGYTVVSLHTHSDSLQEGEAHLVRLAVHPDVQGRGIGRQLLADAIHYAHTQEIYRIQLNTQESNRSSQRLYERFGFRRRGRNVPVMTRLL